jgi:hypothetical protein
MRYRNVRTTCSRQKCLVVRWGRSGLKREPSWRMLKGSPEDRRYFSEQFKPAASQTEPPTLFSSPQNRNQTSLTHVIILPIHLPSEIINFNNKQLIHFMSRSINLVPENSFPDHRVSQLFVTLNLVNPWF